MPLGKEGVLEKYDILLNRPRIHAMMEQAVQYPLVTVLAGPGYGKTAAVAHYTLGSVPKYAWLNLTRLDNITSRFWGNFLRAVEEHLSPGAVAQLETLGFPDTLAKLDVFLHIFAGETNMGEQLVLVMDDFGSIDDDSVRFFVEYLVEAQLDNVCIIAISNAYTDLDLVGIRSGGVYKITAEDLRFTPEETRELFRLHKLALPEDALRKIDEDMDGWPFALFLLAVQLKKTQEGYQRNPGKNLDLMYKVFEREFFSAYSEDVQLLLVKLALLPGFTWDMVQAIGGCDVKEALGILKEHMFIPYDGNAGLHFFQSVYKSFLAGHSPLVPPQEVQRVYHVAGDYFMATNKVPEAIDCYAKSGQHAKMLDAIMALGSLRMGLAPGQASFVMKHLESLPADFVRRTPLVEYLVAYVHLINLEVDECYALAEKLEARLLAENTAEARGLLGEVYVLRGSIHMMRNREDFGEYYRKACECLPGGTSTKPKNPLLTENNCNFSMQDGNPGALERMERAVHYAIPYTVRVMNGGNHGLQEVFSCEAAYHTGRLQQAEEHAYKAIYMAQEKDQHDLICNAHIMLARVAHMNGDFAKMQGEIALVENYINDAQLVVLYDLRDTALAWFYLKVDDMDKMAGWIANGGKSHQTQPTITIGRDRIIYANYLLRKAAYAELLPFLSWLEKLLQVRGLWADRVVVHILRAIACQKTGREAEALAAFGAAYDMCYHNNIIMPFAEAANYMRSLIDLARRAGGNRFDAAWLDGVYQKCVLHIKRAKLLARDYQAAHAPSMAPRVALSRREQEVLQGLAMGHTREEIAAGQYLSVNTVKSYISSVYNKLGAVNRADAIRIASQYGVLGDERTEQ